MTIGLRDGTEMTMVYQQDLYENFIQAFDKHQAGDKINLYGDDWPVEISFPVEGMLFLETTKIERINFYPVSKIGEQDGEDHPY
jgi:hypothetical protein